MGVLKARVGGQWVDISGVPSPTPHGSQRLPTTTPTSTLAVWGPTVTLPIPIGSANVTVSAVVAGFAQNFSDTNSSSMQVALELSIDGGTSWLSQPTVDTIPFGQIPNGYVNRTTLNTAYSWNVPVVTVAPLLRVRIRDTHAAGTTQVNDGGTLQWWFAGASVPVLAAPVSPSQALGIVAVGGVIGGATAPLVLPTAAVTALSPNTPVYLAIGRRYRVNFTIRAAATGTAASIRLFLRDNATGLPFPDRWIWLPVGNYSAHSHEWIIEGDGTTKQLNIATDNVNQANLQVWVDNVKEFYVEDIGPNQSPPLPIETVPTPWTPGTMVAPWSNIGGANIPLQYRKIGDMVQLRGGIRFTLPGGNPLTTLPVGFRPPLLINFPITTANNPPGLLVAGIGGGGGVDISGLTANTDFHLGSIQFSTT